MYAPRYPCTIASEHTSLPPPECWTKGSINVVFPQHLECKLVGRTIGEILQLTDETHVGPLEFTPESFPFQIPDQIEIGEAYAEDPDEFRSARTPTSPF